MRGKLAKPRLSESTMKELLWLASFLVCATAPAADLIWTNIAGGNWTAAANWSPNQVPTSADTAWITNNGTYTVTVNAAAAATNLLLGVTSGTQTLSQTAGTFSLGDGGSSSLNGAYAMSGNGILTGSGTLALAGPFNWSGGTVGSATSNLMVMVNGGLNISGAGTKTLNGGTLINLNTGSLTGGQVTCNTAVFSNAPSATFDLPGDGNAFLANSGYPSLVNAGTFRKTGGTGVSTITVPFHNSSLVEVQTGTLALNG